MNTYAYRTHEDKSESITDNNSHRQIGVKWNPGKHNHEDYKPGKTFVHYHNPEEQHTIAYKYLLVYVAETLRKHVTENVIHTDSGLSEHEGHTGVVCRDITYSKIWG